MSDTGWTALAIVLIVAAIAGCTAAQNVSDNHLAEVRIAHHCKDVGGFWGPREECSQ